MSQPRRGGGRRKSSAAKHTESEDLTTTSVLVAKFCHSAARREAELTNVPMINEHLQTFKYRCAHWHERAEALNGQGSRLAWSIGGGPHAAFRHRACSLPTGDPEIACSSLYAPMSALEATQ